MKKCRFTISKEEPYHFCWFNDAEVRIKNCEPVLDFVTVFDPDNKENYYLDFNRARVVKYELMMEPDSTNGCRNYSLSGKVEFEIPDEELKFLENSDYSAAYGFIFYDEYEDVDAEQELDWAFLNNHNVRLEVY